jgi:hypothetical protein
LSILHFKSVIISLENKSYEFFDPGTWGARQRRSPIHAALRQRENEVSVELVSFLLEHGAKVQRFI